MPENPLELELADLARALDPGEPSPGLAPAVLARVAAEPVPARSGPAIALARSGAWVRAWLRWLLAALLAVLGAGVAVSPVGAQVAEWFDFGGVVVSTRPDAPTGGPDDAEVPEATGRLTLEEAAAAAGFQPAVPAELGPPDGVEVLAERRLVSMSWDLDGRTVRLDQFRAELWPLFWKTARGAESVVVGEHEGLWFAGPHEVIVLDDDGQEAAVPPRLAGRTLIWVVGDRTYRLEGNLARSRAVEIAASVR